MLRSRILTALLVIPFLFWAIFAAPFWLFSGIGLLVIAISAWEWSHLVGFKQAFVCVLYVACVLLGAIFVTQVPSFLTFFIAFCFWIWALCAILAFNHDRGALGFQWPIVRAVSGIFILIACWQALLMLRFSSLWGPGWLAWAFCMVWAVDTGGYFVGRTFGKRPLVSRVSPKKTRAGLWGGIVFALLVAFVGSLFFDLSWTTRAWIYGLAFFTAIFSTVGDLTVSLLKRQVGVKDCGHILPGHGGLLDRMDSVAAGTMIFAFGLMWIFSR